MWRMLVFLVDGAPTVTGGVFQYQRQRRIVSPIVAKPPPLLAAVFPWEHRGRSCNYEDAAFTSSLVEPLSLREVATTPCDAASTTAGFSWSRGGQVAVSGGGLIQQILTDSLALRQVHRIK
ncbi:hypothetical protein PIB30_077500 [Stylosanthes scabra]|uniref:Secreted protein n=1 Tax=Stylosanthes scabra TaxID=79078 RepID=A0ABU6QR76_9FABA|nr:hypothetical protein [Stylosanthes scabra]